MPVGSRQGDRHRSRQVQVRCLVIEEPVFGSTGSSAWQPGSEIAHCEHLGPLVGGVLPSLIMTPVNSYTLTPGSGTICLPSGVTVPWP